MYINYRLFDDLCLMVGDVEMLTAIKQKETEFLIKFFTENDYRRFKGLSYVEHIKAQKKDEHPYTSLRLSKAGKKALEALGTADVAEEDKTVFEWLKKHYLKLGKEIGNGAKTQRHIRDFRIQSGIEKNNLIELCLAFIRDEDNMEYNHKLEFLFYKAPTAFETRFNLEESRLYKYYIKRESYFKSIFKEY